MTFLNLSCDNTNNKTPSDAWRRPLSFVILVLSRVFKRADQIVLDGLITFLKHFDHVFFKRADHVVQNVITRTAGHVV